MAVGYVYILSNPTMVGLLKVGFTCSEVDTRARELAASTGVPAGFVIEYFRLTRDVEEVESKAHDALVPYRVNKGREFFRAELKTVIEVLDGLAQDPALRYARDSSKEVGWTCRRCGHQFVRRSTQEFCPKCEF